MGPTARELLAISGAFRVHSVFAASLNLARIGDPPIPATGGVELLHLRQADAGPSALECPFGTELAPDQWGPWHDLLRTLPETARLHWRAETGRMFAPDGTNVRLGATSAGNSRWDAAVPQGSTAGLGRLAELPHETPAGLRADAVRRAILGILRGEPAAAEYLLGRGQGLTPAGDDVLIGALAVLHAAGLPGGAAAAVAQLGARIAAEGHRLTTAVSCAYLRDAVRNRFARPVREVVREAEGASDVPRNAVARLLAVGHTSGRDSLYGIGVTATLLRELRIAHRRFVTVHQPVELNLQMERTQP